MLNWSYPLTPTPEIRYDHVIAPTPFGRIVIIWKGWKEHDLPCIYEFPGRELATESVTLEAAKNLAQEFFDRLVAECAPLVRG